LPHGRAENIDVNLVPHEAVPRTHDLIERTAPALCHAVGVVHALRTIDAQADQETMRLEEARPFVVEKYPVGLDRGMIFWPGFLYFATRSIERRKNSRPIKVGSRLATRR